MKCSAITLGLLIGACCAPAIAQDLYGNDVDRLIAGMHWRENLAPVVDNMRREPVILALPKAQQECIAEHYTIDAIVGSMRPTILEAMPQAETRAQMLAFVESGVGQKMFRSNEEPMTDAETDAFVASLTEEETATVEAFTVTPAGQVMLSDEFPEMHRKAIEGLGNDVMRICNIEG